jgi:hypothetical protein
MFRTETYWEDETIHILDYQLIPHTIFEFQHYTVTSTQLITASLQAQPQACEIVYFFDIDIAQQVG